MRGIEQVALCVALLMCGAGCTEDADTDPQSDAGAQADSGARIDGGAEPDGSLTDGGGPDDSGPDGGNDTPTPVTFRLSVSNDVPESIYVQLNDLSGQPVWITVLNEGTRQYIEERCEWPDCGVESPICGAAIPMVRDITGGTPTGSFEYAWDGVLSHVVNDPGDVDAQCEVLQPAPPGDYVARFCFGLEVDLMVGGGDDKGIEDPGAPGVVTDPACVEVPFTHPESPLVEWQLQGG